MVRTRSGIEVRVTQPNDVENEISNGGGANDVVDVESDNCGRNNVSIHFAYHLGFEFTCL